VIGEALQRTHGHKARAAPLLGLTGFQLYACLKRYQIEVAGWLGTEGVTGYRCWPEPVVVPREVIAMPRRAAESTTSERACTV
jgi:hypothetical protein